MPGGGIARNYIVNNLAVSNGSLPVSKVDISNMDNVPFCSNIYLCLRTFGKDTFLCRLKENGGAALGVGCWEGSEAGEVPFANLVRIHIAV